MNPHEGQLYSEYLLRDVPLQEPDNVAPIITGYKLIHVLNDYLKIS